MADLPETDMGRKKIISDMNAVVHKDNDKYKELDLEHGMNPSGGTPDCGNAEALEDLFVAATAHWFTKQLKRPFQEVVYAPNRKTELRCGFDLSIAPVNSTKLRLRIQSKLSSTWCDVAGTIVFEARDRPKGAANSSEAERFRHQVRLLCAMYESSNKRAYPYLLVHQCYCLHDYRRMGRKDLDVPIPGINHGLRSMAVDLTNKAFIDAAWANDNWRLEIKTDPGSQKVTCQAITPNGAPIGIEVRQLQYLVGQLTELGN